MIERIPVVGPRDLPAAGPVRVWTGAGSGSGHDIQVHAESLALSRDDDGQGQAAVYDLCVYYCQG